MLTGVGDTVITVQSGGNLTITGNTGSNGGSGNSVGEEEIGQILAFVHTLDINKLADGIMQQLFEQLGNYFESDFSDITPTARSGT